MDVVAERVCLGVVVEVQILAVAQKVAQVVDVVAVRVKVLGERGK